MRTKLISAIAALVFLVCVPAQGSPLGNLVTNGDFEAGLTGFSSDYAYVSPEGNNCWQPGTYTVTTAASNCHTLWEGSGDHTTGAGNAMYINGRTDKTSSVWLGEFAVTPNTDYFFEAFVKNVCCNYESFANAALSFYANDTFVGAAGSGAAGIWERATSIWNSASTTLVALRAVNESTVFHSNDYGLDDIYFGEVATTPTPEPATMGLVLTGIGMGARYLRRRRNQQPV